MYKYVWWIGVSFIWVILTLIVIHFAFHFLSIASTIGNIAGITMIIIWIIISYITSLNFIKK